MTADIKPKLSVPTLSQGTPTPGPPSVAKNLSPVAPSVLSGMGSDMGPLKSGQPSEVFRPNSGTTTGAPPSNPPWLSFMGKHVTLTEGMGKLSSYYPALAALALTQR
jgi:hypothetical protein